MLTLTPITRSTREVSDARAFELNGESFTTDAETLQVLHSITASARTAGDGSAVQAVVFLGLDTGRIQHAA